MNRPAIYSFGLSALAIICATVLLLSHVNASDITPLWLVASAGGGAGAMASNVGTTP